MLIWTQQVSQALKNLNIPWPIGKLDDCLDIINDAYEGRAYHNIDHINNGLNVINSLSELSIRDSALITLAWIYHDIYYKAGNDKNEQRSAIIAATHLKYLEASNSIIQIISEMIIATNYNFPIFEYRSPYYNLITDIDLVDIADREKFALNSMAVRHEFSHVSTEIYKTGRKQFFEKLLATRNNKIFLSKELDHLNEVAIRNLKSYIRDLDITHADIYTIKEFKKYVRNGYFIDDDGSGYYGNDIEHTYIPISCKDLASKKADIPRYCTRVHWFNK